MKIQTRYEFICECLEMVVLSKRIPFQFKSNLFSSLWIKHLWVTVMGSRIEFSFANSNTFLANGCTWLMHVLLPSSNSSCLLFSPFFISIRKVWQPQTWGYSGDKNSFRLKKLMKFTKLWSKIRRSVEF